ncbi:SpoIID/LytB domain-containing protein [Nocardia beijingensis]|uniref:SpoIID/LytB domain-containing protein n=1 Tax=Nocardia beijingensis TaxID=95162 RepID=UPI00082D39F4|nr:SpoIID/LytB domain-containing protein [Nocardia beijingensis]
MLLLSGVGLVAGAVVVLSAWPVDVPYRPLAGPGHGRGLSQVGAFENARAGWGADRILAHYYPGATFGTVAPVPVGVRLAARDGSSLDVFAATGLRVAGRQLPPGQAAHLTPLPGGGATVVVTVGCDGDVLWQAQTDDPWVQPIDPRPNRPVAEHLTLCGGPSYRGALGVALDDGAARTINQVDVEDYLLGVVPAEVQPNWADKGAAEALRAQAIAARSYVLAEQRYPYAQTCDTTACQSYPGTEREDPRTAAAVAATAGAVLLREGRILRTEYSAAPDGGEPADIRTMDVGPAPEQLLTTAPGEQPPTRAADTESAIDAEYRRIGGANSSLGTPIGPQMILPQHAGTYRMYTNGVIIATPTLGAQVVDYSRMLQVVPEADGAQQVPSGPAPALRPDVVPPGGGAQPGAPGDAAVSGGPATPGGAVMPGSAIPPGSAISPGGATLPGSATPPGGAPVPDGAAVAK